MIGGASEVLAAILIQARWRDPRLKFVGSRFLVGVPESAKEGREWVTERLSEARAVPADLLDDVRLLTSELVTNAITHTRSRGGAVLIRLGVSRSGDPLLVHVEVVDAGSAEGVCPQVLPCSSDSENGRGLFLLDHLASRWGVAQAHPGTAVWAQIHE
ncbi:ATP-binding protein [Streptosporangium algeriense]|uniref:ATP-binding protein n=1 Tax=Streptosporangium algeriense TaxID=1682748 RepID=A0ABW3DNY3_9ACTN